MEKGVRIYTVVIVIPTQLAGPHSLDTGRTPVYRLLHVVSSLQTVVQPTEGWRTLVGWGRLTIQIFHLNDEVILVRQLCSPLYHQGESSSSKDQQKLTDHYLTSMEKFRSWEQQRPVPRRQGNQATELKILVLQDT